MAPQTMAEKAKAKLQAVLENPNRNDATCTRYHPPQPHCLTTADLSSNSLQTKSNDYHDTRDRLWLDEYLGTTKQ